MMKEVRKIELGSEKVFSQFSYALIFNDMSTASNELLNLILKRYKERIASLEEEVESLVSHIERLKKSDSMPISQPQSDLEQRDYRKLKEQCMAQEEEIQTLVAQLENITRKRVSGGDVSITAMNKEAEVDRLREELTATKMALVQERQQAQRRYQDSDSDGQNEWKRELEELR